MLVLRCVYRSLRITLAFIYFNVKTYFWRLTEKYIHNFFETFFIDYDKGGFKDLSPKMMEFLKSKTL